MFTKDQIHSNTPEIILNPMGKNTTSNCFKRILFENGFSNSSISSGLVVDQLIQPVLGVKRNGLLNDRDGEPTVKIPALTTSNERFQEYSVQEASLSMKNDDQEEGYNVLSPLLCGHWQETC